jgi:hypothetical protein
VDTTLGIVERKVIIWKPCFQIWRKGLKKNHKSEKTVSDDDSDEPCGEVSIRKEWMLKGRLLENPEEDRSEEKSGDYERGRVEDKDAADEEKKENSAEKELGSRFSEKNGEGEDTVGMVALDVFEIFYW